jgi:threonine/homoserine/homoserine lactone efflux protein
MLALSACAYLGAIISTIPVGPINITLIALSLRPDKSSWYAAMFGVCFADTFYAVMTYILLHSEALQLTSYLPANARILGEVALLVIILLSIVLSRQKKVDDHTPASRWSLMGQSMKDKPSVWLFVGLAATALEPGLPIFWISWWAAYAEAFPSGLMASFLVGLFVVAGDLSIFKLYERLSSFLSRQPQQRFDPQLWSLRILYLAFVLIAADLIYRLIF